MSAALARWRAPVIEHLERTGRYPRWVLIVALTGMFSMSFPVTILTVSLGDIAREFGTSEATLAWVISAPMLLSALALPILGKMGDLYGHRRVFITGFTLATVAAALTSLSWSAGALIGFRTLSQVIGAATQPTSMALVLGVFAPKERAKAMGYWTLVTTAGPTVGLVAGGPLVELVGWRLIFVIQACIAVVVLLASVTVLKETERKPGVRFDLSGATTLALGAGALMVVFSQGTTWGWTHAAVLLSAVVAPVALAAFVTAEKVTSYPLLPLEYFRRRNFTAPMVCAVFLGGAYMGGFVLTPLLMRFVLGYSLAQTAFFMVLRPLTFSVSSPLGGHLAVRIGERQAAVAGTFLMTIALVAFAVGAYVASTPLVLVGLVLQGVGNGIGRPSLTSTLANAVEEHDLGIATASNRMVHQIGASFGIAVLTALYGGINTQASFGRAYVFGAILAAGSFIAASFLRSADREEIAEEATEDREPLLEPATTA